MKIHKLNSQKDLIDFFNDSSMEIHLFEREAKPGCFSNYYEAKIISEGSNPLELKQKSVLSKGETVNECLENLAINISNKTLLVSPPDSITGFIHIPELKYNKQ